MSSNLRSLNLINLDHHQLFFTSSYFLDVTLCPKTLQKIPTISRIKFMFLRSTTCFALYYLTSFSFSVLISIYSLPCISWPWFPPWFRCSYWFLISKTLFFLSFWPIILSLSQAKTLHSPSRSCSGLMSSWRSSLPLLSIS